MKYLHRGINAAAASDKLVQGSVDGKVPQKLGGRPIVPSRAGLTSLLLMFRRSFDSEMGRDIGNHVCLL